MPTYRVREYSRPVKKDQPLHDGMNPYWVYCSNDFQDYYAAIQYAIREEKRTGIKNWVECTSCDEMLIQYDQTHV